MRLLIADLLLLGASRIFLPVGVVALVVQIINPNKYTPYWADILLIVIGLIIWIAEFRRNKREDFTKYNREVERKRLERKSNNQIK